MRLIEAAGRDRGDHRPVAAAVARRVVPAGDEIDLAEEAAAEVLPAGAVHTGVDDRDRRCAPVALLALRGWPRSASPRSRPPTSAGWTSLDPAGRGRRRVGRDGEDAVARLEVDDVGAGQRGADRRDHRVLPVNARRRPGQRQGRGGLELDELELARDRGRLGGRGRLLRRVGVRLRLVGLRLGGGGVARGLVHVVRDVAEPVEKVVREVGIEAETGDRRAQRRDPIRHRDRRRARLRRAAEAGRELGDAGEKLRGLVGGDLRVVLRRLVLDLLRQVAELLALLAVCGDARTGCLRRRRERIGLRLRRGRLVGGVGGLAGQLVGELPCVARRLDRVMKGLLVRRGDRVDGVRRGRACRGLDDDVEGLVGIRPCLVEERDRHVARTGRGRCGEHGRRSQHDHGDPPAQPVVPARPRAHYQQFSSPLSLSQPLEDSARNR